MRRASASPNSIAFDGPHKSRVIAALVAHCLFGVGFLHDVAPAGLGIAGWKETGRLCEQVRCLFVGKACQFNTRLLKN